MECHISNDLFESLKTIVRHQNNLLLKEICRDKNWNYNLLKKKYLKDKVIKEEIMSSISCENTIILGKKKIKIKKLKPKQKESIDSFNENSLDYNLRNQIKEEVEEHIKMELTKPKKKRIIKKKVKKNEGVECRVMKYKSKIFYVNEEENVYNIDGDFCGILEDNGKINFDAEEAE